MKNKLTVINENQQPREFQDESEVDNRIKQTISSKQTSLIYSADRLGSAVNLPLLLLFQLLFVNSFSHQMTKLN